MIDTFRIGAVILAGGRGSRMHSTIQKQYMLLNGRPLISYALEAFEQSCADELVLVTGAGEESYVREEILPALGLTKLRAIVTGGKERYHSVYEGLKALQHCDYVLIHDGARPFILKKTIEQTMQEVKKYQACVVAVPVKDTVKIADEEGYAKETPERKYVWAVQTPQVFSYPMIYDAYEKALQQEDTSITDDAMVLEKVTGRKVRLIEGSYRNIKITTPEDLLIAECYLEHPEEEK